MLSAFLPVSEVREMRVGGLDQIFLGWCIVAERRQTAKISTDFCRSPPIVLHAFSVAVITNR